MPTTRGEKRLDLRFFPSRHKPSQGESFIEYPATRLLILIIVCEFLTNMDHLLWNFTGVIFMFLTKVMLVPENLRINLKKNIEALNYHNGRC